MCWYHVIFDIDHGLEHILDARLPGLETIVCKFGSDPAICLRVREEAICAKKFTDGRTDGRRTPRHCISLLE